eukprot:TRINITY_DN2763_c0_g1_i1.p1 TRINITY_DN2763_c0_g1~~TRINITY_DN2763_c0_g1_i1.p1  ORF type:complete len:538 (+),score=109.89 TRINITY_DN2763_c0_g1_i1:47-1660(+)
MTQTVTLVDYGAGNVRSVVNAVKYLGYEVKMASTADQILSAEKLIFPGVGAFGSAMDRLQSLGFIEPLQEYIKSGKPFFGVCLGMQTLFDESEESPGIKGLGVIPGKITRFAVDAAKFSVPHMGWNGVRCWKTPELFNCDTRYYFVHSYVADAGNVPGDWILTTTDYGGQQIVSSVQKGNVMAAQFHPEKSGGEGLNLLKRFLCNANIPNTTSTWGTTTQPPTSLGKRVIACLDVRSNDNGDIVVTKGDQYKVREEDSNEVRNLGKPVDLAERYYLEGADEITFLNITSFRHSPLKDQPMLEVLRQASERIFVPLCVGGGIRDTVDPDGTPHPALEVAGEYFRSGADKVSLGSDAVYSAIEHRKDPKSTSGSAITTISKVYGRQAVVVSCDPKRVYGDSETHKTFEALKPGPNGETQCWYQCTAKGGRETADLSALELAQAVEEMGAGEILLNCIDHDGSNNGFETALISNVKTNVTIPVIASSGAGCPDHFVEVFNKSNPDAALAAGIFHREEVTIKQVKDTLTEANIPVRSYSKA